MHCFLSKEILRYFFTPRGRSLRGYIQTDYGLIARKQKNVGYLHCHRRIGYLGARRTCCRAGSIKWKLGAGNYSYKVTYVTQYGETAGGTTSNVVAASANDVMSLTSIPTFSSQNATQRKIYRTAAGGSSYLLVATLDDNTTTTYTDMTADGSLGAAIPTYSTADSRQQIQGLTALAGGGQSGATLLPSEWIVVETVANIADSVILPTITSNLIGLHVVVRNIAANSANVFPASGQTINALAANAALACATNWRSF